jgi:hypothetical protein
MTRVFFIASFAMLATDSCIRRGKLVFVLSSFGLCPVLSSLPSLLLEAEGKVSGTQITATAKPTTMKPEEISIGIHGLIGIKTPPSRTKIIWDSKRADLICENAVVLLLSVSRKDEIDVCEDE